MVYLTAGGHLLLATCFFSMHPKLTIQESCTSHNEMPDKLHERENIEIDIEIATPKPYL